MSDELVITPGRDYRTELGELLKRSKMSDLQKQPMIDALATMDHKKVKELHKKLSDFEKEGLYNSI